MEQNKESRIRSLFKGFTWRILATATTITIAYIITGEVGDALKIGGIEFFGKLIIYYLHERAWQAVPRGTIRKLLKINSK
jgi:adenylylsulfate kinase